MSAAAIPNALGAPQRPSRGGNPNTDVPKQCQRFPDGSRQRERCIAQQEHRNAAGGAATISALKVTPSSFKVVAGSVPLTLDPNAGAAVSYTLSADSVVNFTVLKPAKGRKANGKCVAQRRANRTKPRCTRKVPVGAFGVGGTAGSNSFRFTGVVFKTGGTRAVALKRGKYTLQGRPKTNKSSTAKAGFQITK